jgi:hypothetical protein
MANRKRRKHSLSTSRGFKPTKPISLRSGKHGPVALRGAGGGCLCGGCAPRAVYAVWCGLTEQQAKPPGWREVSAGAKPTAKSVTGRCMVGRDFPGTKSPCRRRNKCLIIFGFLVLTDSIQQSTSPARLTVCNSREPPARCKIRLCDH